MRDFTYLPLKINEVIIPRGKDVNYLGIRLDRKLTWQNSKKTTVRHKCSGIKSVSWQVFRIFIKKQTFSI